MKIKYINTDEDIEYMKEVLAKEAFQEGFKSTRRTRLIGLILLLVIIISLGCIKIVDFLYFKVFFSFILLIFYLGYIGIIVSQLRVLKGIIRRKIDRQMNVFFEKFNTKGQCFSELIIDGNEITIKSKNNEKYFLVTFIKEIKKKNDYVYFECIDGSDYFINCKYFNNRDEINEFINFIEINLNQDLNEKIKQNNMINPINTMSYFMTKDNLLSRYEYGKSINCYKEIVRNIKRTTLTLLIVVLSLLILLGYYMYPIYGHIALLVSVIMLYVQRKNVTKVFYKNLKKEMIKSFLLDSSVNFEIDEANIYIYDKYTFKKYNLNKNFKAFEFEKFVLVTFLDLTIIASIPCEAFESENDKKEFIDLFESRKSLEKK